MTNVWAKPELQPEVISLLRSRGYASLAVVAKQAGYDSIYLFKKDYKEHIPARADKIKIPRKREVGHPQSDAAELGATPAPPPSTKGQVLISGMLTLIGLALSGAGLALNYQFYFSQGQSEIMGIIGVCGDCGTAVLPLLVAAAWDKKRCLFAVIVALALIACFFMTVFAGLSFAGKNIGDGLQARGGTIERRQSLNAERIQKLADRDRIREERDPQAIEQLIAIELKGVGRLSASEGCTNITTPASAVACATLTQLRAAKTQAERRIKLDNELSGLSREIAALPPIAVKDPGADQLSRLSWGWVTPQMTEDIRTWITAILPCLGGILLLGAKILIRD